MMKVRKVLKKSVKLLLSGMLLSVLRVAGARAVDIDMDPLDYWQDDLNDRFARLQRQIAKGEASLKAPTARGVVMNLLGHLEIPPESQVLVYSRTSAQNSRIFPRWPRAIYFSDNCYVGWVQGGAVEVMAFDPVRGAIFYLMEIPAQPASGEPTWSRPQTCLNCHGTTPSSSVPGGLVRSVFPGQDGMPFFQMGTFNVDETLPLEKRWGGWYVTGDPGVHTHMGNALARRTGKDDEIQLEPVVEGGMPVEDLREVFNTEPYPGGPYSDIVALMVLEHQIRMHNIINQASLSVRQLSYRTHRMYENLGEEIPDQPTGTLLRVIQSQARRIVEALLFTDEFQLKGDGVLGNDRFQTAFLQNRRPSQDDRSLKDFRLYERIFKYRCSYVIYSDVFRSLPDEVRHEVLRLLNESLSGRGEHELASHLSRSERSRTLRILRETIDGFPQR